MFFLSLEHTQMFLKEEHILLFLNQGEPLMIPDNIMSIMLTDITGITQI